MTVTLYAHCDIKDVLIADGVRTWIEVERVEGRDLSQQWWIPCFRFTFETEGAAMAFRLRYSDHLIAHPSHPCCDELMALEAA
jgi:hypothetical protein